MKRFDPRSLNGQKVIAYWKCFGCVRHEMCSPVRVKYNRKHFLKKGVTAEIEIKTGAELTIQTDDKWMEAVDEKNIWVDYKTIGNVVSPGKRIFIDDGLISVVVKEIGEAVFICVHIGARYNKWKDAKQILVVAKNVLSLTHFFHDIVSFQSNCVFLLQEMDLSNAMWKMVVFLAARKAAIYRRPPLTCLLYPRKILKTCCSVWRWVYV